MTSFDRFIKIGNYLPSAILISVAMMFSGLHVWVDAAWTKQESKESKNSEIAPMVWARRSRPVLDALFIMIGTHFFGAIVFLILSSRAYNYFSVGTDLYRCTN